MNLFFDFTFIPFSSIFNSITSIISFNLSSYSELSPSFSAQSPLTLRLFRHLFFLMMDTIAILSHVVPSIGVLTSNALLLTTMPTILLIRHSGRLGAYYPVPTVLGLLNCLAWLLFAIYTQDPYVFASNIGGVGLSAFYLLTAYEAKDITRGVRDTMAIFLACGLVLLMSSSMVNSVILPRLFVGDAMALLEAQKTVAGLVAVAAQFTFYSSPLLAFREALRAKNSIYFHRPLAYALSINSALWMTYGFLIKMPFMYVPSTISLFIALMQILCCSIWPATPFDDDNEEHAPALPQDASGRDLSGAASRAPIHLRAPHITARQSRRCYSMIM